MLLINQLFLSQRFQFREKMGGVLQSWLQCCHERGTSPISAVAETSRCSLDHPVLWAAVQLCCAGPHRSVCDAGPRRASRGAGHSCEAGLVGTDLPGLTRGLFLVGRAACRAPGRESLRPQEISTRQGQKRDGCVHLFGLSGATLQRGSRLLKICVARFTTGLSSAALSLLPQGPSRRPPVCDVPTGRAALHDLPLCSLGRNPQVACLSPASPASRPLFVSPPQLPLSDTILTVTPWFKGASGSLPPSGVQVDRGTQRPAALSCPLPLAYRGKLSLQGAGWSLVQTSTFVPPHLRVNTPDCLRFQNSLSPSDRCVGLALSCWPSSTLPFRWPTPPPL